MPSITVLTGPPTSGKNTIAHLYATRHCPRCAVIDDTLAQLYRRACAGNSFQIVRLMPTWPVVLQRLKERPPTITEDEARSLYTGQEMLTDFDASLDDSALSPDEVAAWLSNTRAH